MSYPLKLNQTSRPLLFPLALASDHITPATGLTPTVTISKNGAAFAAPAGAVSEVGSGWYKVAGNATDENTLGPLTLHATAGTADPVDVLFQVVAFDPDDGVHLGLTSLPNAAAAAANGLITSGTGANQLFVAQSGKVDLQPQSALMTAVVPFGNSRLITNVSANPTLTGFEIGALGPYNDNSFRNFSVMVITGAVPGEYHRIKTWNHLTFWAEFEDPWTQLQTVGTGLILIAHGSNSNLDTGRILGLSGDLMVEDDVVMDPNGSGFRKSWNYYIYDTEANRAAHVYQSPNAARPGLRFKYAALRHIAAGVVIDFSMSRVL